MENEQTAQMEEIKSSTQLNKARLLKAVSSLKASDVSDWNDKPVVYRSLRHAVSWLINYANTEIEELEDEFVSDTKDYDCYLVTDINNTFVALRFRLKTAGRLGYTEYGIEVRRDKDDFACLE